MQTHHIPAPISTSLAKQPQSGQAPQQDALMTTIIGGLLLGGVIVSASTILLGVILLLLHHPDSFSNVNIQSFPQTPASLWAGLVTLHSQAFIVTGLLLLIATPVLRVAVSVITFVLERDRLYIVITLMVLAILVTGFLLGKGGA